MAIDSFNINGTLEKYDYNGLENKLEIDTTLSEAGKCADAQAVGEKISELSGLKLLYIGVYDANFGSVTSNAGAGVTNFNITCTNSEIVKAIAKGWTVNAMVLSGVGAFGNPYSHYARNVSTSGNNVTFEISSNAMNLSNATHTLTVRFVYCVYTAV